MLPPRFEGMPVIQVSLSTWKEMGYEMERLHELGTFGDRGWITPERFLAVLWNHWLQKPPGGTELKNLIQLHPGNGRQSWKR